MLLKFIGDIDSVREDYLGAALDTIDSEYGGMDSFLRNEMALDEEKLNRLRTLYLE